MNHKIRTVRNYLGCKGMELGEGSREEGVARGLGEGMRTIPRFTEHRFSSL